MGLLKFLFSNNSSSYSDVEHYLSSLEIKKMISNLHAKSLTDLEEQMVEDTIMARRGGDGKISMRQIDKALRELKQKNKISEIDRKALTNLFINYFSNSSNTEINAQN